MIKKLGASVLLAAAFIGISVMPAGAAQNDGQAYMMCALCWPTPAAR